MCASENSELQKPIARCLSSGPILRKVLGIPKKMDSKGCRKPSPNESTKSGWIIRSSPTCLDRSERWRTVGVPLPTYPYGKSLDRPYIVGIYGL